MVEYGSEVKTVPLIHIHHICHFTVNPHSALILNTNLRNIYNILFMTSHFSFSPHVISPPLLSTLPQACDVEEFLCGDGRSCVSESWLCDGELDCPDGSDETPALCESIINMSTHFSIYITHALPSYMSHITYINVK